LLINALGNIGFDNIGLVVEIAETISNIAHTRGAKLGGAICPVARAEHKRNAPGKAEKGEYENHIIETRGMRQGQM